MSKVPVPFADWRPDLALLDNEFASVAENVYVGANSYLPVPSLEPQTTFKFPPAPDTGKACGLFSARTSGGDWRTFGGSPTKLYVFSKGTGWADVSRTVGGAYSVATAVGDLWRFQQTGDKLVAVAPGNDPQWINVDSGSNFARLGTGPNFAPAAQNIAQVGPHLVMCGLDSNKRMIHWSATEDINGWQIATNNSDTQEMPEGGTVQGVGGGEVGYVVQERAIRTMQYLPGDPLVFSFSRVVQDRGCVSKYGFTVVSGVLYFVAEDGFFGLSGANLQPIGESKINDWFLANSDISRRNVVLAFDFQHAHRIGWAFHSTSNTPVYDKMLIYDWALQRWSLAISSAQIWATVATLGLDLDSVGPEPGDAFADSTASMLDSPSYFGGKPAVGAIDINGTLSLMTGKNLPATLETGEKHLAPGMRAFVSGVYPLIDGTPDLLVQTATRERLQDPINWQNPVGVEITGEAALYSSARLHRYRVTTQLGDTWTHAQGVLAEVQQDGTVA